MNVRDAAPTSRVLVVAIMVSMVAFLNTTVTNLALPATEHDLGGGLSLQQWVVDGYLLALAATVLLAGSVSDLFGRVPVMRFGLATFGTGAVLAASATSPMLLIAGRIVQGLGGAFLVPGSLALINSAFDPEHRSTAIGTWTAWTGTAFAVGPLVGGLSVDYLSWRWIYFVSAIPMMIGFALTFWLCPMPGPAEHARIDIGGAALSAVGLSTTVFALIESHRRGWTDPFVTACLVVGVIALLAFMAWERRTPHPMLPLGVFRVRNFAGANLATAFVYGGLTLASIAIALYTQEVAGYSATVAGLATLPTPVLSFLFRQARWHHGRAHWTPRFRHGGPGAGWAGAAAHPSLIPIQHPDRSDAGANRGGHRSGRHDHATDHAESFLSRLRAERNRGGNPKRRRPHICADRSGLRRTDHRRHTH